MPKKSTKEDKKLYQICRENLDLSREKASEMLKDITYDRLVRIEGDTTPRPEEVVDMAETYKAPELRNYYCTHDCEIGKKFVPVVNMKDLSQLTLQMLASLNAAEKDKDRLIEITADGKIDESEMHDFNQIEENLVKISTLVDSLQLWVENMKTSQNEES